MLRSTKFTLSAIKHPKSPLNHVQRSVSTKIAPLSKLVLSGCLLRANFLRASGTCSKSDPGCVENSKRSFFGQAHNMPNPIYLHSSPQDKPEAIVVFLHGLGDTGEGWSWGFKQSPIRNSKVKYIFPTADQMPVTLNAGFRMNSWFDLYGLSPNTEEDTEGIKAASRKLTELVDKELAENPHLSEKNVVIGGFSQGGALALYTAFNRFNAESGSPYGGVIALSTWLPLRDQFLKDEGKALAEMRDTKVFQGHGEADQVVPFQFGQLTSKIIKQTSLASEFKSYRGMQHSSCEEEMGDVKSFIDSFV